MMRRGERKRRRGGFWLLLFILLVVVAAGLVGYLIGKERGPDEKEIPVVKKIPGEVEPVPQVRLKAPIKEEANLIEDISETKPPDQPDQEDYCTQIENGVLDFFRYLNNKNYIQRLEAGKDTYDHFQSLIRKLSAQPPIPAGEGMDPRIMTKNIFHFFRALDKNDLRLLKAIMRNEADTLDMNLDIFYKWFMLGDQCQDPEGLRPSLDVLYQYAGFFLNAIGGRAYLFRRPLEVRLLVTYYCLLIVHEADKRGKNIYGIDIFPEIEPLAREISFYPDFHFQNEYILKLTSLQNYYINKR
jgi:hypothetical protein